MMRLRTMVGVLIIMTMGAASSFAQPLRICTARDLRDIRAKIAGQLIDYTANHGQDHRIYSPALQERRDLYVYLPPQFHPQWRYPVMIYLHGLGQDEKNFLDIVDLFDADIQHGRLPPMIIVCPDGSIDGRPSFRNGGSFHLNSKAGRFEDWIQGDMWNFITQRFPIRGERDAHIIGGASMGGFGAVNHAFKYRDRYGVVFGILPPLNLRYADCEGNYMADFDPNCVSYRDRVRPHAPIARFYGVLVLRQSMLIRPLFGTNAEALQRLAQENPTEMLSRLNIRSDEFAMFIGYGDRDEFNIDAQVESFIHEAVNHRGMKITVKKQMNGRHNSETAKQMFPALSEWLNTELQRRGTREPLMITVPAAASPLP